MGEWLGGLQLTENGQQGTTVDGEWLGGLQLLREWLG